MMKTYSKLEQYGDYAQQFARGAEEIYASIIRATAAPGMIRHPSPACFLGPEPLQEKTCKARQPL